MRILSVEASQKLVKLAQRQYRPPQIVMLKEEIDAKTRVLELKASTG